MNTPASKPAPRAAFFPAFADDEPTLAERRVHRRLDLHAEVVFACQNDLYSHPGVTHDVSQGGVFLATEHLMPPGEQLALTFTIPGFAIALEATAEVRWVREQPSADGRSPAGMGLKFVELPRRTRESIARMLG
jgi:uncharacterized protein (TIGR02266 family)